MIRIIFIFFVIFVFLSSSAQEPDEIKEHWRNTGFNLDYFVMKMKEKCFKSEKGLNACKTIFHNYFSEDKNEFQELQISNSEQLDDLLQKFRTHIEKNIPIEERALFLGDIYNNFLQTAVDPYASLYPSALTMRRPLKYVGIGIEILKYEAENNESLNGLIAINPFEGSSAMSSGLKKGDLILSVNDVSVKEEELEDAANRIKGDKGSQVKLIVLSFCEKERKEIFVTRQPVTYFPNWMEDSHFVNIQKPKALDCHEPPIEENEKSFQALYIPLKSFVPSADTKNPFRICEEFIELQKKDLKNPKSRGMIIDLRGNSGGNNLSVLCMLNTIISATDIMFERIPVQEGEIVETKENKRDFFTDAGPIITTNQDNFLPPNSVISYNKNIVVLVDRSSASASEVFAGTIQDKKRGWVVGTRTFGKGSVQRLNSFTLPGNPKNEPLTFRSTTAIYLLNSGRSPQDFGIFPDFPFTNTGIPIENEIDYASFETKFHFNNPQFDNNQWKQSRPEELDQLNTCIHQNDKMGSIFIKKALSEEKYRRPFIADYHLELAKDILMCLPPVEPYRIHSESYDILKKPYKKATKKKPAKIYPIEEDPLIINFDE